MKIIIEAINFVPAIDLQNFIMKKVEGLNTAAQNIVVVKISLCVSDEGIYSNLIVELDNDKINLSLMDANLYNAVLKSIRYARKFINQNTTQSILLKNTSTLVQNSYTIRGFDFSKN
ncbi:MAG: hypothetical protein JNJ40_03615 [Bacteroidia bacterium]|nr:hypothetical protein [Bacteroidia bacterium]